MVSFYTEGYHSSVLVSMYTSFGNKNEVGHRAFFLVNSDGKGTENRFLHSLNDEIHYGIESSY